MSRSTKKSKIRGITTASSEKKDKQEANRKYRRITKLNAKKGNEEFPEIRKYQMFGHLVRMEKYTIALWIKRT
jgi:hypothetical protein